MSGSGSNNLRVGTDRAMAALLSDLQERIRQLERSTPGSGGGGSVKSPFYVDGVDIVSQFDSVEAGRLTLEEYAEALEARIVSLEDNITAGFRVAGAATGSLQGGITAAEDLTGLSVNVVATAGQRFYIEAKVNGRQITSSGLVIVRILRGSTIVDSAGRTIAAGGYDMITFGQDEVPGAGTHTYKLQASTSAGTFDVNSSIAVTPNISHIKVFRVG